MKILLPFFLSIFVVAGVAHAQAPDQTKSAAPARPVTNQPAGDPAVAEAQQTLKRFTLQSGRLQEAFTAKEAATINGFYPSTLLTIREGIENLEKQRLVQIAAAKAAAPSAEVVNTAAEKRVAEASADHATPVAAATPAVVKAEKRVLRGREILAAFEGFEFKLDKPEEAESKFALLAEFQKLLQENLAELKGKK